MTTVFDSAGLKPPESVEHASLWLAEAIEWAHERGVTDIHCFPGETEAGLWARIDGELRVVANYSITVHNRIVSRLKVMGRCADYDGGLVQEGRFTLNGDAANGEARLSVIPTLRGDKAVIRLLRGGERIRRLDELGLDAGLVETLRETLTQPQGLVLAAGPSGCGKSTALYAMLDDLRRRSRGPVAVVTIEDPVEQSLPGAAQIGADPGRGLGFAEGLRAVLRQDPDVIMVGEIRDAETASAALQAALTGHRLLSSMHTLTGAEALVRLQQMGAPPYVISSALAGVLNLRLVKLLCEACRQTRALTDDETARFPEAAEWPEAVVAESTGCEQCLGSGHQGRVAVGEWSRPTPETATALQTNQPAAGIAQTLRTASGARATIVGMLRKQRVATDQWKELAGLASVGER